MTRLLLALVALSSLGFLAYRQMYGSRGPDPVTAPTERLQNVKEAAKRIEVDQQRHADDAMKTGETAEH